MKTHHKFTISLMIALVVTAVLVAQKPTKQVTDFDHFPILDYEQKSSSDSKSKKIHKKYNNRHAARISESSDKIFSFNDWEVGLPALPISQSAAVIVGEITDGKAELSEDETNIYSEFTVQIAQV